MIELLTTAAEEHRTTLANGSRSATERDHMVSSRAHQRLAAWRLAENLSVTLPSAPHAIPQLTTSETDFCIELVISVGNLTASQAFFHRCGLAMKNNC
ncbi:Beta-galactosidase [Leclercia adecarboxylata]|uniref:hypothetical protein n=1 Tax=Leclercia adecarboxylata TaxID=83655 RepID=UPI000D8540B8|nr:Beta-galactosidase [Leclercia adecarboxylata]